MIKDFVTYNPDGVTELVFNLPGSDNLNNMINDAKSFNSFIRVEVKELGAKSRILYGVWFKLTVMFSNEQEATWYRLKWA